MANMRTTVVMKTDMVNSTPRTARLTQSELGLDRKRHKQWILEIAGSHRGSVFQEEGDAFSIEFPSVTTAVLAAIAMQQSLRSLQAGKNARERLAIRIVITVGDILHQEQDTIGTVMSLTARIEKVTPPDEIYLSHAAWLVLNKAEASTSFVGEYKLKGFPEPEKVYKVDQLHKTRIFMDQFIVFTDLSNWSTYVRSKSVERIEGFLLEYDDLLNTICDEHEGIIRNAAGDNYFLTFSDLNHTLTAIESLYQFWSGIFKRYKVGLKVGVHKGTLNIFRSYIYGDDIHTTVYLTDLVKSFQPYDLEFTVLTTDRIQNEAKGTKWKTKFRKADNKSAIEHAAAERFQAMIKEYQVYHFMPSGNATR